MKMQKLKKNTKCKIKMENENGNALSYNPGYKTRTCVYAPKAPCFTALLCWLLGFPALHYAIIKRP
jgi:hypothetical protein